MPRHQRPPRGLQQRDGAKAKMKEDNKTQYVRKLPGTIVHGERLFGRFTAEAPSAPGVMGVLDFSNPPSSIAAKHGQTWSNASNVHPADELVVSRTEASNHQGSRSNPSMDTSSPRRSLSAVHRPTLQHDSLAVTRQFASLMLGFDLLSMLLGPLAEAQMKRSSALYHQLPQQSPQMLLSRWQDHQEVLTYDPFYGARPIPLPATEQRLPRIVIDDASPVGPPGPGPGSPRGMDLLTRRLSRRRDGMTIPGRRSTGDRMRGTAMPANDQIQQASFPTQLNPIHAPIPISPSDSGQIVSIHSTSALLPSLPTRISMDDRRSPTYNSQYGANLVALPRIRRTWDLTPSVTHDPIPRPSNPLAEQLLQPALSLIRAIPGDYGEIRERDHVYGSRPIPLPEVERLMNSHAEEALPLTGESTATLPSLTWGITSISASMHPTLLSNRAPTESSASYQDTLIVRGVPQISPTDTEYFDHMQDEAGKSLAAVMESFAEYS
ncbi:predicted protein [Postia placenta Mad-698-R]|uniref:Uncharacterized protein n=1 Tax=Postia placenta MAD-698-R-SB12 TaxID=670580 RepID=A0A1X6N676_9APHY|nr:hypothetical protein POSPLADRAFT_1137227 [Postia placenta MAD-698-R-SB12]EED81232.1 predicted protein [Postia placenta Mad-698-R]OSX63913.1 hypothetical protein POSPLADRAFT_1137227 [Postia placenta MAD-698-R-SB12]